MTTRHYCVYTQDPNFEQVIDWVMANQLEVSVHLNRTRFWINEDSPALVEFLLRFSHVCGRVENLASNFVEFSH